MYNLIIIKVNLDYEMRPWQISMPHSLRVVLGIPYRMPNWIMKTANVFIEEQSALQIIDFPDKTKTVLIEQRPSLWKSRRLDDRLENTAIVQISYFYTG